jgi:hypothetical protein
VSDGLHNLGRSFPLLKPFLMPLFTLLRCK